MANSEMAASISTAFMVHLAYVTFQYLHLARHLGALPGNGIVFITQRTDANLPCVRNIVYKPQRAVTPGVHHHVRETEAGVLNAQNVARIAIKLRNSSFTPDVMLGHNGWGELWYLKDVYPEVPLIGYFEFFYRRFGADVGMPTLAIRFFLLTLGRIGAEYPLGDLPRGQPLFWSVFQKTDHGLGKVQRHINSSLVALKPQHDDKPRMHHC